jgi:hypothetical protein
MRCRRVFNSEEIIGGLRLGGGRWIDGVIVALVF